MMAVPAPQDLRYIPPRSRALSRRSADRWGDLSPVGGRSPASNGRGCAGAQGGKILMTVGRRIPASRFLAGPVRLVFLAGPVRLLFLAGLEKSPYFLPSSSEQRISPSGQRWVDGGVGTAPSQSNPRSFLL